MNGVKAVNPVTAPSGAGLEERVLLRLPRLELVDSEPPIHEAKRLAASLDARRFLVKRDDLIGLGLGGNKVRGLELFLGEALALGSDVIVTGAGPQSNHVRATALIGRMLGLDVVAVLWGSPLSTARGNLQLTQLAGARLVWTGSTDRASVDDAIAATVAKLRARGRRPYAIPRGGGAPLAVVAHLLAARRVEEDLRARGAAVDRIVVAAGSGATVAGWLLWRTLAGSGPAITAWSVSRPVPEVEQQILGLARAAADRLELPLDPKRLRDLIDVRDAVGPGYGVPSPAGAEALRVLLETEAIPLDPTYTAKAFGGWLELARSDPAERDRSVLFIHTGGLPALFAEPA